MKNTFHQKTKQEKILYVIRCLLNIAVVIFIASMFILRIKTRQHIPMPLVASVVIVLLGISRLISARNRHQGSEEDRQKFNKIVIRSAILGPIIAIAFITVVVLIKLKLG